MMVQFQPLWALAVVLLSLFSNVVTACGNINVLPESTPTPTPTPTSTPAPTLVIRATPTSTPTRFSFPKDLQLSDIALLPKYVSSLVQPALPPCPTSVSDLADLMDTLASRGQTAVSAVYNIEPKAVLKDIGRLSHKGAKRVWNYQYIRIMDTLAAPLGLGPAPTKTTVTVMKGSPTLANVVRLPKHTGAVETYTDEQKAEHLANQPLLFQLVLALLPEAKAVDPPITTVPTKTETPSEDRLVGSESDDKLEKSNECDEHDESVFEHSTKEEHVGPTVTEITGLVLATALVVGALWLWSRRTTIVNLTIKLEVLAVCPGSPIIKCEYILQGSAEAGEEQKERARVEGEAMLALEELWKEHGGLRVSMVSVTMKTQRDVYLVNRETKEVVAQWTDTTERQSLVYFELDGESGVSNPEKVEFVVLPAPSASEQSGKRDSGTRHMLKCIKDKETGRGWDLVPGPRL